MLKKKKKIKIKIIIIIIIITIIMHLKIKKKLNCIYKINLFSKFDGKTAIIKSLINPSFPPVVYR